MLGLRTQEPSEFLAFFQLVQNEAAKTDCVFFLDTQEKLEKLVDGVMCADISGWLVPIKDVEEFNSGYINEAIDEKFDDRYAWASYEVLPSGIKVKIEVL